MRYLFMLLLVPIFIFFIFKAYQVWGVWRHLPSGYVVRLSLFLGVPDYYRAQKHIGQNIEDLQGLRRYFGLYGRSSDNMAVLAGALARDKKQLAWLAKGADGRCLIALFAPGYAQKASFRDFLSLGFALRAPSDKAAEDIGHALAQQWVLQQDGDLFYGRTGLDEIIRSEQLIRTELLSLPEEIRSSIVLHRANTLYRLENYSPYFNSIEMDVIATDNGVEINHPPMRRTGLLLKDVANTLRSDFVWLDWKNPESKGFLGAINEMNELMAGRKYLVEIPLEYFRKGGELPKGAQGVFSVYLPTKEISQCTDGCSDLAAFVNSLIEKYPNLDCSFDASIFPWVSQNVKCGRNHGVYSWSLSPLSSVGAYKEVFSDFHDVKAFADKVGAQTFRFIVRPNSAFI
jgi:hypothetical protein